MNGGEQVSAEFFYSYISQRFFLLYTLAPLNIEYFLFVFLPFLEGRLRGMEGEGWEEIITKGNLVCIVTYGRSTK